MLQSLFDGRFNACGYVVQSCKGGSTVRDEAADGPAMVKVSGKRQVTIPADVYRQAGFADYALCTWTSDGLLIQPLQGGGGDVTVAILRALVAAGYEGERLVRAFASATKNVK